LNLINQLFDKNEAKERNNEFENLFSELERYIKGISMVGELTPALQDRILSFGERFIWQIVSHYLPNAVPVDALKVIHTDDNFGKANVDLASTEEAIREACTNIAGIPVVAGFIASSSNGNITTLGRGGSDYTASLFASALEVEMLEIWSSVDGFMTADPEVVDQAYTIERLSYAEAMELSHFGAKVLYPPSIIPIYKKRIPVHIRNISNSEATGTIISDSGKNGIDKPVKGISSIRGISLMTVQGMGMVGVTGISSRLFGALANEKINIILISQASSENSISIAIESQQAQKAEQALSNEFDNEIRTGMINKIVIEKDLSIVAIVGEHMKHSPGIAGKLFHTLGKNGINVIAIAQGASELNLSWVIADHDLAKTLNVAHESFFLSPFNDLNVFIVGTGRVSKHLLGQITQQQDKLLHEKRLRLRITGITNSRKMFLSRDGILLSNWNEILDSKGQKAELSSFVEQMKAMNLQNSIFVDCTAGEAPVEFYKTVLENNISIVAANKIAASSSYESYAGLKKMAALRGVKFLIETNVGAGLPVINTLNDLVNSGDKVIKIEAVLSGTLNFIFNVVSKEIPLSKAIAMARDKGYTEPDPRIDLCGRDVVRKLVILAREAGYQLEQSDVEIKSFLPEKYFNGEADSFLKDVEAFDDEFGVVAEKAASEGKRMRFVARFDKTGASVGIESVPPGHPFYELEGSNNVFLFTTDRYNQYPMIIKGYGAGAEVTAAGVFADIIRVSNI
ncbi:MAG: bifunctional aspartate kinase/homoserine dehydrogenase I, partial [Bacteroidota bacterium]|nr:bifunctional aspartate kinase/homoserine dehydrogenase I [Bacteroidota bacterium]